MARKILCISLTPIERDARVLRQIKLLSEFGAVTTVGFGDKPNHASAHIQVPDGLSTLPRTVKGLVGLALRRHKSIECASPAAAWVLEHRHLIGHDFDLVVANDARVLDLAFALADEAPVWADMHEWAPEERTHVASWRILIAPFMVHLCDRYLKRAAFVTTVSRGIAELYGARFGVKPLLMTNAGPYRESDVLIPSERTSRRIACVHSGAAISGRGLERMIEVFLELPDQFTLDLYLVPGGDGGAHYRTLRRLADGCERIEFHDPVLPAELPETLSKFDLGIFWIPPTHTNARLTLPNKFFDYVQARLGIAIGPSEEMQRELEKYGLGVVSESFEAEDLKQSLLSISHAEIQEFKKNAGAAALPLSFSTQVEPVREKLEDILQS